MRYFIGIDSGGSKTDTVLFDETGHICCRDLNVGCNAVDLGKETAADRLSKILRFVCEKSPEPVSGIRGGIAGAGQFGEYLAAEMKKASGCESLRIGGDGRNVLAAALGKKAGCCMIGGTGSSLFIQRPGEPLRKLGGKGYLIDTGGSGFNLGSEAFKWAFRALDGRCRKTLLSSLISEKLGFPMEDSMAAVYSSPLGPRAFLASFAPLVFQARAEGDWAAEMIFEEQSGLLAELTWAAEPFFEEDFPVILNGGLFTHFPEYAEAVSKKASPRAKCRVLDVPPVFGAALEAMWDAGLDPGKAFRERFLSDYRQFTGSSSELKLV